MKPEDIPPKYRSLYEHIMGKRSKRVCPRCGSVHIACIVYGLPTPDTIKKVEEGRCVLGGCCIDGNDPHWHCQDCGQRF